MSQPAPLVPTKSSGCLPWIILIGFLVASLFMALNVYLSWRDTTTPSLLSPSALVRNLKLAVPTTLPFLQAFTSSPSSIQAPTLPVMEPSLAPLANKETLEIQIQNGSGQPSKVSLIKIALQAAGYLNISLSDVRKYEYDQTVIMQKTGFEIDALNIRKILAGITSLDPANNTVNPLGNYDIIIIIGKNDP